MDEERFLIMLILAVVFTIVWILLGCYQISRQQQQKPRPMQSLEGVANNQGMIRVKDASVNSPNRSDLPTYQEALQETQK